MGTLRLPEIDDKDPMKGWRSRAISFLTPSQARLENNKAHYRRIESGQVDPSIIANLSEAGSFRINIAHEMVPPGWYESEFYQTLFKPQQIVDVIFVATPIGPDTESWLAFERIGEGKQYFGSKERELLGYSLRPMKWLHRQLVLHYGVMQASEPLKPAERRVLKSLLSPKTEQEIAEEHGLTQATIHTYCTRIYRKFNVRGRAGLTALWLGELPG
jgi:DNA-binding CsgD family transcriptional regulator